MNNICKCRCICKQKLLILSSITSGYCTGCRVGNCKGRGLLDIKYPNPNLIINEMTNVYIPALDPRTWPENQNKK